MAFFIADRGRSIAKIACCVNAAIASGQFGAGLDCLVMAGLVPAIHVLLVQVRKKTWMPGSADKFTQSAQA
jgi:hypothetical protein